MAIGAGARRLPRGFRNGGAGGRICANVLAMANATRRFILLASDEMAEAEQKVADAERRAATSGLPGTVVELRGKLDAAPESDEVELDEELTGELERALDEADEDLKHDRQVPREAVFPRSRLAG